MQLEHVGRGDGVSAVLEVLERDGAVIVRDFLDEEVHRRFRDDMVAHASGHRAGTVSDNPMVQKFWGERTTRFTRLAHRSRAFVDILTDPLYLSVADEVLLPNCSDYWMNTGQMMIIGPGQKAQWLHRDAENWPTVCRPDGFEVTLSCLFAISEFTAEVGATRVVPGSHKWDDYTRRAEPHEVCQAVMPERSGVIYTGRVLHSGGANVTADQYRYGLHVSYVLGWLTPEEASPLGASWDDVQHLSPVAQRLLGWRCIGGGDEYAARLWTVDYEDVPEGLDLL
ncbi:MAG: phytanoyl-CoA dioxygenase family protein [Acidobacteria bacterium]|nr:phytanoyl-CoA dioxygenase family protein [Acidobacteriota bacterium]